ncbi:hypothetical protein SAMN05216464_1282 [Mucilaginibacter pineti]|uniref:Uncharacterized protein n=1 Tax=Mucilaginibacter pineti TaxID=1391627 RepID=A0A1G7NKL0_9SPHI|nr:hypothetical protein SAMN05216464_1282 [Mucilaginibacter pineti]
MIKAKNFTQLKKYFAIKVKEADIATYSDDSSTAEDWKEFTDYLSKPGAHYTLDTANSKLYVFGDGKLVTLLTPNRQSALRIYDPKDKSEYLLPLYFYRKSAGQPLTLIR